MLTCVQFLGTLALLFIIGKLLYLFIGQVFFPFVLIPLFGLAKDLKNLAGGATWAVVTGATDGIGKAYAKELARRGFNLVLVSRNQQKLDATAQEIRLETVGVNVETVAFNFTNADSQTYAQVFNGVSKLDVGVLVNNVGVNFEYPAVFHDFPGGKDEARNLVIVNCISPTMPQNSFTITNSACCGIFKHGVKTYQMFPAAHIFAQSSTWIEAGHKNMSACSTDPFGYISWMLSKLFGASYLWKPVSKGNPNWYNDQKLISIWIQDHEKKTGHSAVKLQHEGSRIHFFNYNFPKKLVGYMDAHLVPADDIKTTDPSVERSWNFLQKLGKSLFTNQTMIILENYRTKFRNAAV